MTELKDIGEFGLIERLTSAKSRELPSSIVGPGDDCAVFPVGEEGRYWQLLTTDSMVEGRHFRLDFSSGYDVGWKALAASVSDIAAMGGIPVAAVAALQIRSDLDVALLDEIYRGLYAAGEIFRLPLVGGDTTAARELSLIVSIVGQTAKPPILRSTARAGDDLWLSGGIGEAGAGLALLEGRLNEEEFSDRGEYLVNRHRRPLARLKLGQTLLAEGLASAMIDVSDGLLQDAGHMAELSKVQCELNLADIPRGRKMAQSSFSLVASLCAGDDYELLFAAPESKADELDGLSSAVIDGERLPQLARIGKVRAARHGGDASVVVRLSDGTLSTARELLEQYGWTHGLGYQHFSTAS